MHKISFSSLFNKLVTATAILAMVLAVLPVMSTHAAGSITVNITTDVVTNDANCSLREAIIAANTNTTFDGCVYVGTGPDDIITLASGVTYTLSRVGASDTTGDLDVGHASGTSGNLTIQASGSTNAVIDANHINRVFEVNQGLPGDFNLTLVHITVTNGDQTDGAGIYFDGAGTLTLNNSTVSNNTATGGLNCGAGIFNNTGATVDIRNSTISGNTCATAGADGAGLFKGAGGTLTITGSTFHNNTTADNGGGARIDMATGTATITNSTFANNTAGTRGGGVQAKSGTVNINFSTFSGNSANSAGGGGAIQSDGGTVTVTQSILADSIISGGPGADCDQFAPGTVDATGSLVELNNDCGGLIKSSTDPNLGTLADNGGPTLTMALLTGSPAINIADDASCLTTATDQRGVARPQGAHCDLGAYEFDAAPVVSSINRVSASPTSASTVDFTVTFSEAVTGVNVSDFVLTTTGVTGASITGISGSGTIYTVTVNTGTGDGTIRLDLVDDDSIQDVGGNALGGTGTGNGNFSSGQVYTVQKPPVVSSITRVSADPTSASSVNFTVTFSEAVTGVNTGDFVLTTTGVTGTSITGVSGSGATYIVTVNTGTGDGTIRLNVVDDNTIIDVTSNPLGGVNVGDGNYVNGEVYTINKGGDTTGVFRPSNGLLYLKNSNTTGFADIAINYGIASDYPVVGDWDGNGTATIGIYRNGSFYLRNSNTLGFADLVFPFGQVGDQPIAGDWNGDGIDTIGIFRPSTGLFLLRNSNDAGPADAGSFFLGNPGDVGIAGDWTAKGYDTVGVFRPVNGIIFLKNTNQTGFADIALNYGIPGDRPVTGDWNDDGIDTIGVYRNGQFLLRNSNTNGFAEIVFGLGNPGDMPIAGNWDGIP